MSSASIAEAWWCDGPSVRHTCAWRSAPECSLYNRSPNPTHAPEFTQSAMQHSPKGSSTESQQNRPITSVVFQVCNDGRRMVMVVSVATSRKNRRKVMSNPVTTVPRDITAVRKQNMRGGRQKNQPASPNCWISHCAHACITPHVLVRQTKPD